MEGEFKGKQYYHHKNDMETFVLSYANYDMVSTWWKL